MKKRRLPVTWTVNGIKWVAVRPGLWKSANDKYRAHHVLRGTIYAQWEVYYRYRYYLTDPITCALDLRSALVAIPENVREQARDLREKRRKHREMCKASRLPWRPLYRPGISKEPGNSL